MTVAVSPIDPLHTLTLSIKQLESIQQSNARYNIWVGAVRSGKSFASLLALIMFCKDAPAGDFAIIGKSITSIKRNILGPLKQLLGDRFQYYLGKSEANLFNRTIHLVGANDERAEHKIRGMTIIGAYVDEITIIPETVFQMLKSRLSLPGARLYGTTNPDSPFHWFKEKFIDIMPPETLKLWNFTLDDNPSLDAAFVASIKKEYVGLWYDRYIAGLWVLAEGTVYDFFDTKLHVIATPPCAADYYVLGIDYGTHNPCAFALIGYSSKSYPTKWLEKEYYYDSKKELRQKSDTEYADDLIKFATGYNVRAIYIDPSALSFKVELMRKGFGGLIDAENEVLDGIRYHGMQLSNGSFKICAGCSNAIQEYGTYRWNTKASSRGEDEVFKANDHLMDAIRYVMFTHFYKGDGSRLSAHDIETMKREAFGTPDDHGKFFNNQLW